METVISDDFKTAIGLRFDYMLNRLFVKHGIKPVLDVGEITTEASILGWCSSSLSEGVISLFANTPLQKCYIRSYEDAENLREDVLASSGSQEEWDALSDEEQDREWDRFHHLCAQGVADEMYFYDVMMKSHLVGYVGD